MRCALCEGRRGGEGEREGERGEGGKKEEGEGGGWVEKVCVLRELTHSKVASAVPLFSV